VRGGARGPRDEIHRRRFAAAVLAPQRREQGRKRPVAAVVDQHADRDQCRPAAARRAMQLETAVGPVGEVVVEGERRGVHPDRVEFLPTVNKAGTPVENPPLEAQPGELRNHELLPRPRERQDQGWAKHARTKESPRPLRHHRKRRVPWFVYL